MTFVYPQFLWALLAVLVPIIIHLFNFRRYKKVYFTNVRFLRELQIESKSKSRLKELLVLLLRCLLIASLVLAFAQPLIVNKEVRLNKGPQALSIYLDNSFSSENLSKQGPLIQLMKARAKEIIKAHGNADKFQIITNDFEGRHQRFNTKEDALAAVDEVKVSPAVRLLSDVLNRQSSFLNASNVDNKKIYLLSDAQRSTFNLSACLPDTAIRTIMVPLEANRVNNVFVDSCWFETPLQQKGFIQKLHARIVNKGQSDIDAGSAKLYLNKRQVAIASFSMEAGADREIQFTFECKEEGDNFGAIKIEDYPITFDDELFFSFSSRVNISVVLINGSEQNENNALATLFRHDSIFKLKEFGERSVDYSAFRSADVLVLNQLNQLSSGFQAELLKFSQRGGSLVFIPSAKTDPAQFNGALNSLQLPGLAEPDTAQARLNNIDFSARFFDNVFDKKEERMNLPLVNQHFKLLRTRSSPFESILTLQNGDPFFGRLSGSGTGCYLFAAPLDDKAGNFTRHALFVPLFYRLCFNSLKPLPLFYPVSSNVVIQLKSEAENSEKPPLIRELSGATEIIPERRLLNNSLALYTQNQVNRAGFYQVLKGDSALRPLAFNYSRKESDLSSLSAEDLNAIVAEKGWKNFSTIGQSRGDISSLVFQNEQGKQLWKLFIILALLFILAEALVLRLLK